MRTCYPSEHLPEPPRDAPSDAADAGAATSWASSAAWAAATCMQAHGGGSWLLDTNNCNRNSHPGVFLSPRDEQCRADPLANAWKARLSVQTLTITNSANCCNSNSPSCDRSCKDDMFLLFRSASFFCRKVCRGKARRKP